MLFHNYFGHGIYEKILIIHILVTLCWEPIIGSLWNFKGHWQEASKRRESVYTNMFR